ncbi:MAG: cupin domain-containing protein [Bdellovibrionia bacterium]
MKKKRPKKRKPIVLMSGEGRVYPMGRIRSIFKADGKETDNQYSISEWWLEPNTKGPHTHAQDYDHAWYVIKGTMMILIENKWINCSEGSFVVIPAGVPHGFENRSKKKAGILSFNNEAGFEKEMAGISKWFHENPPDNAV